MPTLGRPRKRSARPVAALLAVVAVALLFTFWRLHRRHAITAAAVPAKGAPTPAPPKPAVAPPVVEPPKPAAPPPAQAALSQAGLERLQVEIHGPLETAIVGAVGPERGQRLAQVLVRSLVWWIAVPNDLRPGDRVEALYQEVPNEDPIIFAIRYQSHKNERTYQAFRFKSASARWPRVYDQEGREVELRLTHAPLDEYEQVTSLLRDGRRHKGVDFKTPVDSPVKAPFDAVVVRKNWNWRGNGNSIELRESGGRGWTAIFLHLAEPPAAAVGARVTRGQVIGKSGNTGHSFAPHLHYQLMAGQKVLDPFAVQETYRRQLPANERTAFAAEAARLGRLLDVK